MTKKELRNILEEGWAERREKVERQRLNGIRLTKEWKDREKNKLNVGKRRPHYLGS